MSRYIKRFYKNYMKTRPIKFYLSLSILLFLFGGSYYMFKYFQVELLFNSYILQELDNNLEEVFFKRSIEEENLSLINSVFFFKLSSFSLVHIYFFLKICMFFHLFFTLYSVLFDYLRDCMSITFFLLSGLILYFMFLYSLDFLNLSFFSKNSSLDILANDLNLILRGEEALENCSKFSLNMFKLWLISIYNIINLKIKNLGSLSWHSELF